MGTVFCGDVCGVVVAMNDDFRDLNNEAIKAFMGCLAFAALMLAGGLVLLWITF